MAVGGASPRAKFRRACNNSTIGVMSLKLTIAVLQYGKKYDFLACLAAKTCTFLSIRSLFSGALKEGHLRILSSRQFACWPIINTLPACE